MMIPHFGIDSAKAIIDLKIATDRPPKLVKSALERGDPSPVSLVVATGREIPDPAHLPALLTAYSQRPPCRCTTDKRDELASLHCNPPHVLSA
jgi:hypothetical protein